MARAARLSERLRRLGLQRRIMLFVAAGLAVMFGVLALLGLGAIDQATQLVFQERLATAYTTAGILERDFARVADDAGQTSRELAIVRDAGVIPGAAGALLAHFEQVAPYPFFRVTRIWLLSADGQLLDTAGSPSPTNAPGAEAAARALSADGGNWVVGRAVGPVPGAVAFASVVVRLGSAAGAGPVAVCDLVSVNATTDYVPATYGRPADGAGEATTPAGTTSGYHLEVVDPDGIAVLGIGSDERPGQLSHHFSAIRGLMASGGAAAMIHQPGPGDTFAPHVMSVVPLPSTPFYVVLEQPIDVALALPNQLEERLLLTIGLGFVSALAVAWVTTRHVVKPTEQLTEAAGRMAGGDLASPIAVRADDEVGLLAESLEAMRQQLLAARDAAQRTTDELERRVADRTARLNQVLGQTITAQEEERRRVARELHDETAQSLAALAITLDRARDELGDRESATGRHIGDARSTAARLLAETRRLIVGLRPAVLDDLGLLPAIRWFAESTLAPDGIDVEIRSPEAPPRLPAYLEAALFRIAQEAMTNVARHAGARHVTIELQFGEHAVTIGVADDGHGFDVEAALNAHGATGEHVGLIGLQERVRLLNGRLDIQSSPDGGTHVVVEVPIGAEDAAS